MIAAENMNAYKAVKFEKMILDGMVGKLLKEYSFKQKDQAVLKMSKQKMGGEIYRLDPSMLF